MPQYLNQRHRPTVGPRRDTVLTQSGAASQRQHPIQIRSFNTFTGGQNGSSGSIGNLGSSNLPNFHPTRIAATDAVMFDGIAHLSYTLFWENVEPFAPVNGVHSFDWTMLDQALLDAARYPGAKVCIRINSGNANGAPNWVIGGGTDKLTAQPATGQKVFNLPGRSAATLPVAGQQVSFRGPANDWTSPYGPETLTVSSVNTGTGDVTCVTNINNKHGAGTIVEWTKPTVDWATATAYVVGDLVRMPEGTIHPTTNEDKSNIWYCCSQAISAGQNNGTAANFLTLPGLCEVVNFASGTGDVMATPWDAQVQAYRGAFLAAFGARYNGHPLIACVYMPGAGWIGEMNLIGPDSVTSKYVTWAPRGFTYWRMIAAWKFYLDTYAAAFPNTPLAISVDEPLGLPGSWPNPTATAVGCTTNSTAVVGCTNTAGLVQGQQITPDANAIALGIPANTYIGTIIANTSFRISRDPNSQVDASATATAGPLVVSFNSSKRSVAVSGVTNENAAITCAGIHLGDQGKTVTGLTGISANRFVGTVTPGVSFLLSTDPTKQVTPASHVISGATATLGLDGQSMGNGGAGLIATAVVGSCIGGTISNDVYTGGTPIIGYSGSTYPGRITVQQNGLGRPLSALQTNCGANLQGNNGTTITDAVDAPFAASDNPGAYIQGTNVPTGGPGNAPAMNARASTSSATVDQSVPNTLAAVVYTKPGDRNILNSGRFRELISSSAPGAATFAALGHRGGGYQMNLGGNSPTQYLNNAFAVVIDDAAATFSRDALGDIPRAYLELYMSDITVPAYLTAIQNLANGVKTGV